MKRSLMAALGTGLAVAALTGLWTTVDTVSAQEAQERVVGPRAQVLSLLGGGGGYLGVAITEVNEERATEAGLSEEYGAYVTEVVQDGPAAEAGLEVGDVIVGWNGDRMESAAQLQRLVRETPSGRTVDLQLIRDGSPREVSLELGDRSGVNVFTVPRRRMELRRPEAPRSLIRPDERGLRSFVFSGRSRLGVSVQSLGEQLADYFGVEGGALVTAVSEGSPAEAAGLRAGDVIVELGGEAVDGPGDLLDLLRDLDAGPVSLRVVRDGSERSLTAELEEARERSFGPGWRDGDVRLQWEDGEGFLFEPFVMQGLEIGPIELEGWEMEPFEWELDLGEWGADEIRISVPRIEIPGFEMPAIEMPDIEVPGFQMTLPRIVVQV